MKKFFKLIPAALAVVALASCSNDELFGEKAEVVQKVKDGLTVQVEDLDGASTRQANATFNGHGVVWEEGDQINVYDNKLTMYDEYKFVKDEKKFKGVNEEGATRISSTQYALFPADRVDYAGWASEGTKAVMRIPEVIFYDEESEFGSGKNYAYVSNLPMWGTASGSYPEAEVSLHYLTGVLRLNITNAFAKEANFIKIESQDDQPISGAFQAFLSEGSTVKDEAYLEQGSAALQTANAIYIDLRNAPSYITNLYIPIIARYYDYLKVGYTNIELDATALPENSEQIIEALDNLAWSEDEADGWKTIRNWDAGITFNRGKMRSLYEETQFDLSGVTTCEMLSETFAQYENYELGKDTPADVLELTIGGENGLFVTRTSENYKDDYTIYLPNMKPKKIIVNIPAGIQAGDPNPDLMIVDKDIKDPFAGELVINVMEAGIADGILNSITVNMPKADFRLAGQIAEDKIIPFNRETLRGGIQIKNVDDVFFGDGVTATEINAQVTVNTAKTVNITDNAKLISSLDVVNTKNIQEVNINAGGELEGDLEVLNATVNCDGTQGASAYVYGSKGTVNIGGEAGNMNSLYTIGDVNIANTAENVAIKEELSLLGNNTVTLKQGYIAAIVYNMDAGEFNDVDGTRKYGKASAGNYGKYYVKPLENLTTSDCRAKIVTIKLDEIIGDGLTAIGSVQDEMLTFDAAQAQAVSGDHVWNFIKFTDSKWGGKVPGEDFQEYAVGKEDGHIYTATELAAIEGCAVEDGIVLYNNFDLNNEPWTNPDLTVNFDGEDPRWATARTADHLARIEDVCAIDLLKEDKVHTISNLYLKDETDNTELRNYDEDEQFGLLGKFEGEECKNFIINKVKTTTLEGTIQIGAVAGVAEGAQLFTNIQVANAKLGGTTYFQETPIYKGVRYVGGLIGKANVTAELSIYLNKISKTTISGQGYMGGLIGAAVEDNTVKIDRNNVSISGFVVGPQPENYDMVNKNYGTVGMAIGQVDEPDGQIDEDRMTHTRAYDAGGGNGTKVELGLFKKNKFNDAITGNRKALGFLYNFLVGKYTDSAMEYLEGNQLKYGFYGGDVLFGYSPNSETNIKADDALSPLSSVENWTHDATIWVAKDKDTFVDDTAVDPKYRLNGYLQFTPYLDADPAY